MTIGEVVDRLVAEGMGEVLDELERMRLANIHRGRRIGLIIAGVWLAVAVALRFKSGNWLGGAVLFVIALLVWQYMRQHYASPVASRFKQLVMPYLVGESWSELAYCRNDSICENEFEDCGLFISPDSFWGKDYAEGMIGETDVRFSMVHAQQRHERTVTETDSDGNTHTRIEEYWTDIFKGLFFSADFNKEIYGTTLVRPGKAGFFGGMSKWSVKLEDPRFTELFTVKTNDQVEARYILTPAFMERITALAEKLPWSFSMAFRGSRVYIALNIHYDTFEPSLKKPCTDKDQLAHMLYVLDRIVGIVFDLDLNTRIWRKQAGETGYGT